MMKVYTYANCGTCRKAIKWLDNHGVKYDVVPIRQTPPTKTELRKMLKYVNGNVRALFNTSGGDYKALNLKDKLPTMTDDEAIDLLSKNGNLVKRPFILTDKAGFVGFNQDLWDSTIL